MLDYIVKLLLTFLDVITILWLYRRILRRNIKIMKGKSQDTYNLNSPANINTLHAHVCV